MTSLLGHHRVPAAPPAAGSRTRRAIPGWERRWSEWPERTRTTIKLAVLGVAVVVAYSYSLETLVQSAGLETPLAYASLVPFIAVALAALRARPLRPEPDINDRQVDYIVGIPLVMLAITIEVWLPGKLSAMFWVYRLDLLSLPFFVAGAVAILFGTRVLWRQKLAVGYLFLAWPLPYTMVLLWVLNAFTTLTLAGLHAAVHLLPLATASTNSDYSIFSVTHHGASFDLSVVSACSGVNGIVGFLLIGVAFGAIVRGPRLRKALWLFGGMLLLWCINIGRLLFIFWAGKEWGEHIAIGVLHPFVGLVTFSIGVLIMVLLLHPIGLEIPGLTVLRRDLDAPTRPAPSARGFRPFTALAVVAASAIVLGATDAGLRSYNLVADASGTPRLLAYRTAPVAPGGWTVSQVATFDWAKPLFGDDSTWDRYSFQPDAGGGDLHSDLGMTFDVIDSGNLQSFAAYGIEACYQFHGFSLRNVAQVRLAGGIVGQTLSYTADHQSWSIVYWIVPVKLPGQAVRYERLVLYLLDGQVRAQVTLPRGTSLSDLGGALGTSPADRALAVNRAFLVSFADELLRAQASPTQTRLAVAKASAVASPVSEAAAGTPGPTQAAGGPPASQTPMAPRETAFVSLKQ